MPARKYKPGAIDAGRGSAYKEGLKLESLSRTDQSTDYGCIDHGYAKEFERFADRT
jgi:hypothetical protein